MRVLTCIFFAFCTTAFLPGGSFHSGGIQNIEIPGALAQGVSADGDRLQQGEFKSVPHRAPKVHGRNKGSFQQRSLQVSRNSHVQVVKGRLTFLVAAVPFLPHLRSRDGRVEQWRRGGDADNGSLLSSDGGGDKENSVHDAYVQSDKAGDNLDRGDGFSLPRSASSGASWAGDGCPSPPGFVLHVGWTYSAHAFTHSEYCSGAWVFDIQCQSRHLRWSYDSLGEGSDALDAPGSSSLGGCIYDLGCDGRSTDQGIVASIFYNDSSPSHDGDGGDIDNGPLHSYDGNGGEDSSVHDAYIQSDKKEDNLDRGVGRSSPRFASSSTYLAGDGCSSPKEELQVQCISDDSPSVEGDSISEMVSGLGHAGNVTGLAEDECMQAEDGSLQIYNSPTFLGDDVKCNSDDFDFPDGSGRARLEEEAHHSGMLGRGSEGELLSGNSRKTRRRVGKKQRAKMKVGDLVDGHGDKPANCACSAGMAGFAHRIDSS